MKRMPNKVMTAGWILTVLVIFNGGWAYDSDRDVTILFGGRGRRVTVCNYGNTFERSINRWLEEA